MTEDFMMFFKTNTILIQISKFECHTTLFFFFKNFGWVEYNPILLKFNLYIFFYFYEHNEFLFLDIYHLFVYLNEE